MLFRKERDRSKFLSVTGGAAAAKMAVGVSATNLSGVSFYSNFRNFYCKLSSQFRSKPHCSLVRRFCLEDGLLCTGFMQLLQVRELSLRF